VPKFLVDEYLSLNLVEVARSRRFPESSHVVWMGKSGWKDWELKRFILDGDWTFVTRNIVRYAFCPATPARLKTRWAKTEISYFIQVPRFLRRYGRAGRNLSTLYAALR
jgi:hypothetical protein